MRTTAITKAALIATFSGQANSKTMTSLWDALCGPKSGLNLTRKTEHACLDAAGAHSLIRFNISRIEDSEIFQLRLQSASPSPSDWQTLWAILQAALNASDSFFQRLEFWGWTLAFYTPRLDTADATGFIMQIPEFPKQSNVNIYQASAPGGRLRLLEAADYQSNFQKSATCVYVATAEDKNVEPLSRFLLGPKGAHPYLELMLHKCYYQYANYLKQRDNLMAVAHQVQPSLFVDQAKISDQLNDYYVRLKQDKSFIRHISRTMGVNYDNYHQRIASDFYLNGENHLWRQHTYRIGRAMAQIEHDQDYLSAQLEAVESILKTKQTQPATASVASQRKAVQGIDFNMESREVWIDGRHINNLSSSEFKLLRCLYENQGRGCSRVDLLNCLYPDEANIEEGANTQITLRISRLRNKIEPDQRNPRYIQTLRKRGYKLVIPPVTESSDPP